MATYVTKVVERVDTVISYPSGTGVLTAYSYVAADEVLRHFIGSLSFVNITAGKNMTITVTENIGGAGVRTIDSKAYLVGTDPDPHFDFNSFGSITITAQIDISEGISRNIPRAIIVQNAL